ncbi:3beta-hydroxysteroid-dehydrogenase/decarboxylase [Tripterygium wilfordii]|uniref:3beta-hydroxysteroid- dehydrogenase/decarboxylase n=1 Tax=Tripterygium wilfordii TaxID=458696 RepID=UPI0018F83AD6|nr:3beta-hydroxysteroid-dehydrogenase/decarboxylase [Tripterygium wilfordii]
MHTSRAKMVIGGIEEIEDMSPRTCVVLGGRGFLGRSLVLRLLRLGNWIVRVADSAPSLQLEPTESRDSLLADALASSRASYLCVDVRDKSQLVQAIGGSSVVFFMEATGLQSQDLYCSYMTIVQGAKNVIAACHECSIRKLIYNSSADVVVDGLLDILNGDESLTCHWKFDDMLTDLKAQAEGLVLFANNIDGLLTCALRPTNVFGPGDPQLVPFLLDLAKSGWAKFIIGTGENISDFTYAENVSHALICAAEALDSRMVSVAGKAFFITNLEPIKFWEFVSLILEGLGYQRPFIKLPAGIVWYIFLLVRWMHGKLGLRRHDLSMVNQFIQLASHTRTFNCAAAQNFIGYSPVVTLNEGIVDTVKSFSQIVKSSPLARYGDFGEQSKVDKLLGSGKVADILLWRDEKKTFAYFLALSMLYYWFFLCGKTFTSSAAQLLLLLTIILCAYGLLPLNMYGIQWKPITSFEISATVVTDSVRTVTFLWNRGVRHLRLLAQGDDWNHFFKIAGSLYLLKLIILQSITLLVGIALVFAFTAFFVYEQYEPEIDGLARALLNIIMNSRGLMTRNLPASAGSYQNIE